jgi:phenylalanyl-tRNA synthetase beta chain
VSRGFKDLRFVELGTTYRDQPGSELPQETRTLGVLLTGELLPSTWATPGSAKADALAATELIRAIGALLRVDLEIEQGTPPVYLHPGRGATVLLGGREIGVVGELHPRIAAQYDLGDPVAVLELDADALLDAMPGRVQYTPFAGFPPVTQDLAVVIDDGVPAKAVVSAARGSGSALLRDVRIFDVYRGAGVDEGKHSLALRLTFRAEDRTLTEEEATAARTKILKTLEAQVGAVARG